MRLSLLAALLAALAAAPAGATPAQDNIRHFAAVLLASAKSPSASPQIAASLNALLENIRALVAEKPSAAASAKPVADETSALLAALRRGESAPADKLIKLSEHAQVLLPQPTMNAYVPHYDVAPPPADANLLAAFQKHAASMAALMRTPDFEGAPAAPASVPALANVPLPRPRAVAPEAKPAYGAQTAYYQGALNPFLKSQHRRAIAADGSAGPGTAKAVAFFQSKHDLPQTGVIDGDTEKAILADFQERRHLPVTGALDARTSKALRTRRMAAASTEPVYFEGGMGDFEAKPGAQTIKNALATVYTPFLAKTKKQKRMEGPPIDHHDQTVCTLERYLADVCPYVSVAIDPRLNVPNGTPLLIPEISSMAGKTVHFRIVDTGSKKRFKGTGHIDVATDSSQNEGFGRQISGHRFTLVLPEGLRPAEL